MVVYEETQMEEWIQSQEEKAVVTCTRNRTFSVVAIQSVACCLAILLALLLRVAGGEAYASLQMRFQRALVRNEWVTALAVLWDGNPLEKVESDEESVVKQQAFTDAVAAPLVGSTTIALPITPLASGTLTSAYGERIHPIDGTREFHSGVDIAAPLGTELVAVYDGEVIEVGENDRIGKYVCLLHKDGVEILYGHCSDIFVEPGVKVCAGESVAAVGSTGVSTGSHVHIAVSKDGRTCDPATYVSLERYA